MAILARRPVSSRGRTRSYSANQSGIGCARFPVPEDSVSRRPSGTRKAETRVGNAIPRVARGHPPSVTCRPLSTRQALRHGQAGEFEQERVVRHIRDSGFGARVPGGHQLGIRGFGARVRHIRGFGFRVPVLGARVPGAGCRVPGSRCRVSRGQEPRSARRWQPQRLRSSLSKHASVSNFSSNIAGTRIQRLANPEERADGARRD